MTIYISPNPGKTSASEIALRAAQILLTHGAAVLMSDALRESCNTAGVIYLPLERCLKRADVILTIGGDGTILHEANLSLRYAKPILGINLGRCGFLATCEIGEMETKLAAVARGDFQLDNRMLLYARVLGQDGWEGHALNDVVVTKGRLQQAIDFSIYCGRALPGRWRYRGDPHRLYGLLAGSRRPDSGFSDQGRRGDPHLSPQSGQSGHGICAGAQAERLCGAGSRR